MLPYIIPYISPCDEFRLKLISGSTSLLSLAGVSRVWSGGQWGSAFGASGLEVWGFGGFRVVGFQGLRFRLLGLGFCAQEVRV